MPFVPAGGPSVPSQPLIVTFPFPAGEMGPNFALVMISNISPESAAGGCTLDEAIINRLPAVRAATRAELYRRLLRGRAFLEANYAQAADLCATARVACLSPFHFLRLFKVAFGRTPHQYLTDLRLAVARKRLVETQQSVGEIGLSLGFENVNSFGRLFRRHQGITPQSFRRLCANG